MVDSYHRGSQFLEAGERDEPNQLFLRHAAGAYRNLLARILEERAESQALRRGHPTDYLLSGLIRCGQCNRAYVGTTATGRSRTYSYYTCSTRYRYGTKECSADRLPRELLEAQVFDQLAEVYQDSELIAEALNQANLATDESREESERRLEALRQKRAGSQRAFDRYFAASRKEACLPLNVRRGSGRYTRGWIRLPPRRHLSADEPMGMTQALLPPRILRSGRKTFLACCWLVLRSS